MGEFVPLTNELVSGFYGAPAKRTMRGYAYREGDQAKMVFGVYFDEGRYVCFCDMPELAKRRAEWSVKKVLVRAAAQMKELLLQLRGPVHSLADPGTPAAGRYLEHIGFEHLRDGIYAWRRS